MPRNRSFSLELCALIAGLLCAANAQSAVVFSTNSAAFLAANPGLILETFENAKLPSGSQTSIAGTLNSSTNNSVFATGSVVAGFSLSTTSGGLYVSRDVAGNAGSSVSSNSFTADMNIAFAPNITAVGIDLLQWQGNNAGWTIEAFDAGNLSLGSLSTRSGSFIGLTSTTAIARLFLNKPDSGGVIDNLRFGTSGDAVPEPATLLLLAISVAALLWLRSSKAAAQTRASALRIKTKNPRE
jgi:hypothetical protein